MIVIYLYLLIIFSIIFCWRENKRGIVLWGMSDPKIFGHDIHINLLRDEKYLRPNQFLTWDMQNFVPESFVEPIEVIHNINRLIFDNI